MRNQPNDKLNYEEFFSKAILNLRDLSKSRGIHTVYSGFNAAFRKYYNENPILITQKQVKEGKFEMQPRRGGYMIYLKGEAPISASVTGKVALDKILSDSGENIDNRFKDTVQKIIPSHDNNSEIKS